MKTIWIHNRKQFENNEEETRKLPTLNKEEFEKLLNDKEVRIRTDDSVKADIDLQELNARENRTALKKIIAEAPDFYNKIEGLPEEEEPYQQEEFDGNEETFYLVNKKATVYDAIQNALIIKSDSNKHKIYFSLYEAIPGSIANFNEISNDYLKLAKPGAVMLLKGKEADDQIDNLLKFINNNQFLNDGRKEKKPTSCSGEERCR